METPFATPNDENLPGEPIFGEKIGKFPESWQVRWLATTGSTNDDLLEAGRAGAPSRVALVTDYQSAGRGRLDPTWVAPDGANMLADAVAPFGGKVVWRAFVYNPESDDRFKQAYDEYRLLYILSKKNPGDLLTDQ
jgi:hypothetical protein